MHSGIYKAKNGTWYIHTTIKGKSVTIRGFYSKKEADENYDYAIEKWKREHGFFITNQEYENVLNNFFAYRSKKVSLETLKKDKMYMKYWSPIFHHQQLKQVYVLDRLKIIYDNLCNDKDIKDTKKYRLITCFIEFSLYCFMNGQIDNAMFNAVKVLFQPTKIDKNIDNSKRYIPKEERMKLLQVIKDENDYIMFSLFIECGMRISEFLGLYVCDFDFNEETISIKRQLLVNGTVTTQLKTSNSYRKLILSHQIATLLNDYVSHNKIVEGRLFRCSHTTFRRLLNNYEKMAGIPTYACHEYRHSVAVDLSKVCFSHNDIVIASNYLGHSVSVYENTYCNHYQDKDMKTLLQRR